MSKLEGISVKLPLSYSQEDGPYKLNKTLGDVIKQNFFLVRQSLKDIP